MSGVRGINFRNVFPNLDRRYAARMKTAVARSGLPMVNAGARFDLSVLMMSGATRGIFVDARDYARDMVDRIRDCEGIDRVRVKRTRFPFSPIDISFRHKEEGYHILYHVTDIKNIDLILGTKRIALYYSAIQGGPTSIPNAGFNALMNGGYLISPMQIGDRNTCLESTGLKMVSELSREGNDPEYIEGYLYQKTRTARTVLAPDILSGMEILSWLKIH